MNYVLYISTVLNNSLGFLHNISEAKNVLKQACVRMNFSVSDDIQERIWEHFENHAENQNFLHMTIFPPVITI
jgi:hypothetical protein